MTNKRIATSPASGRISTSPDSIHCMDLAPHELSRGSYSNYIFCRNNETAAWYVDESSAICLSTLANPPPTTPLPCTYVAGFNPQLVKGC